MPFVVHSAYGKLREDDPEGAARYDKAVRILLKKRLRGEELVIILTEIAKLVDDFGSTLGMHLRTSGAEDIICDKYLATADTAATRAALAVLAAQWLSSPVYGIATKPVLQAMHKHDGDAQVCQLGVDALHNIVNVDFPPERSVKVAVEMGAAEEAIRILRRQTKAHTEGRTASWSEADALAAEYPCFRLLGCIADKLRTHRLPPLSPDVGLALAEALPRFVTKAEYLPFCLFTTVFFCAEEAESGPATLLAFASRPAEAVGVLVQSLRLHPGNPAINGNACILLGQLGKMEALNGAVVEAGACELMISALRRFEDDPVKEKFRVAEAVQALAGFAGHEAGAAALLRLDAEVVAMGKTDLRGKSASAACHALCCLLRNLSATAAGREQLLHRKAHLPLVEALTVAKGHHQVVTAACTGLRNMAFNSAGRLEIMAAGGAAAILSGMAAHGRNGDVTVAGCSALEALACEPSNRVALCDAGAALAVVNALPRHEADADVAAAACDMLLQLAEEEPLRRPLLERDGVARALGAVFTKHKSRAGVIMRASALLEKLSPASVDAGRDLLAATGVVAAAKAAWTTLNAVACAGGADADEAGEAAAAACKRALAVLGVECISDA